jgi:hypothetical protein
LAGSDSSIEGWGVLHPGVTTRIQLHRKAYELVTCRREGKVVALFVMALRDGGQSVEMAECFLRDGTGLGPCIDAMARHYRQVLPQSSHLVIRKMDESPTFAGVGWHWGMFTMPTRQPVIMKTLGSNDDDVPYLDPDFWHLCGGDTDVI